MHVTHTIRTSYGRSRTKRPGMVEILVTFSEIHQLVRLIEKQASDADADGHQHGAELLFSRAVALREAAR